MQRRDFFLKNYIIFCFKFNLRNNFIKLVLENKKTYVKKRTKNKNSHINHKCNSSIFMFKNQQQQQTL